METVYDSGTHRLVRTSYAAGLEMAPHLDAEPRVSVVLRGGVEETACGREETGVPASVCAKPSGTRHANRFGACGAEILSVVQAPDLGRLGSWGWLHGGAVSSAGVELVATLASQRRERGAVEEAVRRLLDAVEAGLDRGLSPSPPRWLEQVRQRLDGEFVGGRSVRSLAQDAGVHPVSLTRAFRRHYRCSVTSYRKRLRVRSAADALATTTVPLSWVAHESGFADQCHLSRVFKSEMGVSPGRFRSLMRLPGSA